MFKKFALKKLLIISLSLLFLLIIYFFPESEKNQITTTTTYVDFETIPIYLIDKQNNLIARFEIIKNNHDTLDIVDEVIDNLTIDKKTTNYIPNNFQKIIPKNTKILSKELEGELLKINFNKELLNVDKNNEEKLIEALIYSLTEIKGIEKIMIFIEGEKLNTLPKSNIILPNTLDRSYGINKIYELTSMKDVSKTTVYYTSRINDYSYYIPVTTINNDDTEKIEIIIEKLKALPTYETNVVSYLTASAQLLNYEILENSINLCFNNEILNLENNKIIEEVKYSIALSVRDTYNINETIFFVDNNLMDAFFI